MAERRTEHVMGTAVTIEVCDRGVGLGAAFAWLRSVDATFSTYRPDSAVSRIARGELDRGDADPVVREVLDRCDALCAQTGGWFDARATGALDPSAFVKGWSVDGAAALLEAAGARRFAINAGGDVLVRGGPWRVGIQHPLRRRRLCAVLEVADLAVATSGTYERGAHIRDPHTGRPPAGVLSVTVAGPSLGDADAYATAAFAMGDRGPAWTGGLRGYEAMTVLEGGDVLSTPGLAALRRSLESTRHVASAA